MWVQRQVPREVTWIQLHQLSSQEHMSPVAAAQSRGTGDPPPQHQKEGRKNPRICFLELQGFFLPLTPLPDSQEHSGLPSI